MKSKFGIGFTAVIVSTITNISYWKLSAIPFLIVQLASNV